MKLFNTRWETLVERAREARHPEPTAEAPPGFATRVLARARAESKGSARSIEELWMVRIRQGFAMVGAVGLALVAMEFATHRPHGLVHPGIENTVAELLWRL